MTDLVALSLGAGVQSTTLALLAAEGEHSSRLPLQLAPIDVVNRRELAEANPSLFDADEDGDPDGCSPYGCRSGEPVTEDEAG